MRYQVPAFALVVCTLLTGNLNGQQAHAVRSLTASYSNNSPASANSQNSIHTVVPHLIKFNGVLQDLAGKPLAGPVDVTFSLYADEAGGSALWFETQTVQADALGHYTVLLGAMTPAGVPMELFTSGEAHWLGVQVSNLPEQPRVLLVSVPYAMKAGDAETLGGKPPSAYALTSQAASDAATSAAAAGTLSGLITSGTTKTTSSTQSPITNVLTQNYIPVFADNLGNLANSIMTQSGTKIGINTATPAFNLDLNGAVFMIGPKAAAPGQGGTMRFRDDTGTQRWLFGIPGTAGSQDFQMYNYANGHAPLFIQNGAASYSLYMAGNGNVGIGTNTPTFPLDVNGNVIGVGTKTAKSGYGGTMRFRNDTGTVQWTMGIPGSAGATDFFLANAVSGQQPLYIQAVAPSNSLFVNAAGDLGIGTGTPSAKLEVNGTTRFDQPVTFASSQTFGTSSSVFTAASETIAGGSSSSLLNVTQSGSGAAAVLNSTGSGEILSGQKSGVEKFAVDSNGNVTIAGNLNLPQNTSSSVGVITLAGEPFVSACCLADNANTFLGPAGNFTLTGEADTGTGFGALFFLTSGSNNTATGFEALGQITSGSFNTAFGASALSSNITGSGNTAMGTDALFTDTTGTENTATGFNALEYDSSGSSNTAVGTYSMYMNSTGGSNTSIGSHSLENNTTGDHDTATGESALFTNGTGIYNAAHGWGALYKNSSGSYNVAVGPGTLYNNSDSSANTAVGMDALYYDCVNSSSSCTASDNTALGYYAGNSGTSTNANQTGSFNTFLGALTGPGTSTPIVNSTAIGANALVSESNAMALGGIGDAAVKVGIGTATPQAALHVYNGDIYVGAITNPPFNVTANALYLNNDSGDANNTFRLDAYGDDLAIVARSASGAAAGASISFRTDAAGAGETERVRIDPNGNVGIGTTTPAAALDVVGDIHASGCVQANGQGIGSCASPSDRRLKTNIRPFNTVLDRLVELRPVHFNWNPANPPQYRFGSQRNAGLIAQQVKEVFPKMVTTGKDGYERVYYHELPFMLLEGVRELKARNDNLNVEVSRDQKQIAILRETETEKDAQVNSLAAQNRRLATQVRLLQKQAAVIATLEARLNRDEAQEQAMRLRLARNVRRDKKKAHREVASVRF